MQAPTLKRVLPPLSRIASANAFFIVLGLAGVLGRTAPSPCLGQNCCITGPMGSSNVCWSFVPNIAACPAGDAVVVPGRPSRLVIDVWYMAPGCTGRGLGCRRSPSW